MAISLPPRTQGDFRRIERVLKREAGGDGVPFFELFINPHKQLNEALWGDEPLRWPADATAEQRLGRWKVEAMRRLGYDFATIHAGNFSFTRKPRPQATTDAGETRAYVMADTHEIATREDFDKHPWPEVERAEFSQLEAAAAALSEGMKLIAIGPGGVLENAMHLLGYEGISYLLYDDPALVSDVFDAVGSRIVRLLDNLASCDAVGAVALGDDMGFKTQTMLSTTAMRKYVFPWQAKIAKAVHRHGKPAILHSCGNRVAILEDVIGCGWDGIHSFEDAIEPVWEAKPKYGNRTALLGGFDVDKLCRLSEAEVRAHVRFLFERCAPGGGWALGSGNSIPAYVPARNYLAMLDEGRKLNGW
ncbi:MAG: hypothetical protein NTW86_17090 [Candidatus Sumerlaeota bacterium]|nr:hypothetical protein [Candidatus Sumerlaeota bacterium]